MRAKRVNLDLNGPFNDREHILYVNGAYRDDSEVVKQMMISLLGPR